jgi:hypothetical protein
MGLPHLVQVTLDHVLDFLDGRHAFLYQVLQARQLALLFLPWHKWVGCCWQSEKLGAGLCLPVHLPRRWS